MKVLIKLFYPMLLLLVTSCVMAFSSGSYNKACQKEIEGRKYAFVAGITVKKRNILGFRSRDVESNIAFYGLREEPVRGKLTLHDFEKKAGTVLPEGLKVDSVCFTLEPGRDDVRLVYYMSNMVLPMKITFYLKKNGNDWVLVK